jgi:predicted nucleic acid-binding protein
MIVLDTNVVSALMRPEANPVPVAWLDRQIDGAVYATAVTIMEIRSGLLLMPEGIRRRTLAAGFASLLASLLSGRVLPLDEVAAEQASVVAARQRARGRNTAIGDFQIAGIALSRGATLATRNVRDFAELDLKLVDPWAA